MSKKFLFFIFILLCVTWAVNFIVSLRQDTDWRFVASGNPNDAVLNLPDDQSSEDASRNLLVSGWLPYWAKDAGVASLSGDTLDIFDEVNPFAFDVNADGVPEDTGRIKEAPWPALRQQAGDAGVRVVPTLLWTDAAAMHRTFADTTLLDRHIDRIVTLLKRHDFPGVDIDYEGKDISDRDRFSAFLEALESRLKPLGKTLSCTVEARIDDEPPAGWTGTRAMSYANDFAELGRVCDGVRLMAYDQVFQVYRAKSFTLSGDRPDTSNAGRDWVESVIRYALRFIPSEKISLGVPTYGWEFRKEKVANGYRYTRVKAVSYPDALAEADDAGVTPTRDGGGELTFSYQAVDGLHQVTVSDAVALRDKIDLAKRYRLNGVSVFKIDGETDPDVFSVLSEANR